MFRPLHASLSQSHGAVRFLLSGTTGAGPNDSAGRRVESPSYARSMSGRAAIERRRGPRRARRPGLTWIPTSMPSPSDATRTSAFRPPRETPTDREPLFSAPRPRAGDLHARGVHGGHPDLRPDGTPLPQCRGRAPCRAVPGPAVEPPADGGPLAVRSGGPSAGLPCGRIHGGR